SEMVTQTDRAAYRELFPLAYGVLVAVIDFLEAKLVRDNIGEMAEHEIVSQRFAMRERIDGGDIDGDIAVFRSPAEPRWLVARPEIARLEAPDTQPFEIDMITVGVRRGDDEIFDEIVAEEEGGRSRGIINEALPHALDLRRGPKFIDIDLPQQAFLANIRERRADHRELALPMLSQWRAIDRDAIRLGRGEAIEIVGRAVDREPVAMQGVIGAAAERLRPFRIMHQLSDAFDDMPVPRDRKLAQLVDMALDEWHAVEDDGEEMQRQGCRL